MKKRLTQQQEFDIMKLVLDKFLWLGTIVIGYGGWKIFNRFYADGITWIVAGAVIFGIFIFMIVKEYEIIR